MAQIAWKNMKYSEIKSKRGFLSMLYATMHNLQWLKQEFARNRKNYFRPEM